MTREDYPCTCCNASTHTTKDCPFLGMNDTNHDHKTAWENSAAGGLWKLGGYDAFEENVFLLVNFYVDSLDDS